MEVPLTRIVGFVSVFPYLNGDGFPEVFAVEEGRVSPLRAHRVVDHPALDLLALTADDAVRVSAAHWTRQRHQHGERFRSSTVWR